MPTTISRTRFTATDTPPGETRPDSRAPVEWTADASNADGGPERSHGRFPNGHKLVLYDTDQSMLFDHNQDPLELDSLYGKPEYSGVQTRLRKKIEEWQKQTRDRMVLPA